MKPKKPNKPLQTDSGLKKNTNLSKPNQKQYKSKNIFKPGHHYTSSSKNDKLYINNFYNNKNEHPNRNYFAGQNYNKMMIDINTSIKHGRNTSAPHLKKDRKNNKKFNKNSNYNNTIEYNEDNTSNKYNNTTIDTRDVKRVKDNISFDKIKSHNKIRKPFTSNKNKYVNHRINNIKQNFNSKTNKKYYNNDLHPDNSNEPLFKMNLLGNTYENNKNDTNAFDTIKNRNTKSNSKAINTMSYYKDIQAKQERIALLKKKLRENNSDIRDINLIGQKIKNNKLKNHNNYNTVNENKNTKLNNTINYNQVNNINIETIDNDEEDKNIVIDNEEKILKSDENLEVNENNDDKVQPNTYRGITPNKNKDINETNGNNTTYANNFDSIDTTSSKVGNSNIKDNSKKDKNQKSMNISGYSYNKKDDYFKKNMPKIINNRNDKEKDLFKNNFTTYNNNTLNSEKLKKKSKSKKIKIMNYPKEDYHFTKSSNVFNLVNNNFNKTNYGINNYNRTIDTSKDKNKSKNNVSYDKKKNNSVKKMKLSNNNINNQNKDNIINKLLGKKIVDKSKNNREHNRSLNFTSDKINSSKVKRYIAKTKNEENNEKINNQEFSEKEEKKEELKEEKKVKNIEKIGCICHAGEISYGKSKVNQDNYFNYKINSDDLLFIGVCDGHGENGHYVSEFLINHLPQDFQEAYINLKEKEKKNYEDISLESITKTFEESFLKTDNDLNEFCDNMKKKKLMGENVPNYFNCDYSGSTCVSILLTQKDINTVYIANVGDSRTIIIKENNNNNWTFEQLSRDHKPTEEDEHKRIIDADGEIEAIEDDNGNWTGPLRVWEKGSEGPGLAMTRSLGDKVGSKIGVVCTPEVFKYTIKEEDRAFIIASDGLWEYIKNQEVTYSVKELINNMREKNENNEIDTDFLVKELFDQSVERWRQKEQGIDDITIICVLLN